MIGLRAYRVVFSVTLVVLCGGQSQAGLVGTQGFADIGSPLADTNNINTASTLTMAIWTSTTSETGVFDGLSTQVFSPVAFSTAPGANTTFDFGNLFFGDFASTGVAVIASAPGVESFDISGSFTPGQFTGYGGVNIAQSANIIISFNQITPGGSISDSGVLELSGGVPEPAGFLLILIGLGGVLAARRFAGRSPATC